MAKMKNDKKTQDNDLDLDDLGDLGDDIDFGDEMGIDDENREPSRSKVVADLAKDAGEGALEGLIKNTAKKALPEDYSANYHDAMDLADFTKEVVSKNKLALNKSTYRLGKEVSKILPFKIGLLEKYLENQQSEFESYKSQTEEQMRDAGIASETATIFDKQLDVQKSLYARTEAREEMEQKERLSQNKVSNEVLANIDGNIAHQTAFTTQISKEYYKRSLELQFKSYYVQADSLRTMRDHYKAFSIQFTNIEKNTSLPDFVKLRNSEALMENMRQQSVASIYTSLIGNSKFLAQMKKKMAGFVSEKVENVTTAMDGVTDMLDMVNSGSEGSGQTGIGLLASMMAAMGGETLGEKISDKISPKIKEKIKDNKIINTGANYLATLGSSTSSALEAAKFKIGQKAQDAEESDSWLGKTIYGGLKSFLEAGTPTAGEDITIKSKGYLTHNQAAIFDNNVHRSITEVIPMYLARILQTSSNLTSMYSQINGGVQGKAQLLRYDYDKRKLDTTDNIARNIKAKVFKDKDVANRAKSVTSSMASDVINAASNAGVSKRELSGLRNELTSKKTQDSLANYIDEAVKITGGKIDYKTLFTDYESNDKLKAIVDADTDGILKKAIDNMKLYAPKDNKITDERLKDVTRFYPIATLKSVIEAISKIAHSEVPHIVNDDIATIISKAFYQRVHDTNTDITPKSVVDLSAFRITAEDFKPKAKELGETINIFATDVKSILQEDDTVAVSAMVALFATLNKAYRVEQDASPKVFQSIHDLYGSDIVGTGELDAANMREGKIKITKTEGKYISKTDLILESSFTPGEIKRLRREKATDDIISKITNRLTGFTDELKKDVNDIIATADKNDPTGTAMKIMEVLKKHKTSFTDQLQTAKKSAMESIDKLSNQTQSLINKFDKAALEAVLDQYTNTINNLQTMIETNKADAKEYLERMEEGVETVSAGSNKDSIKDQAGKLTKNYQELKKKETELLEKTMIILIEQQRKIREIEPGAGKAVSASITIIRDNTQKGLEQMKDALLKYEEQGKSLRDIASSA